MRTPKAIKRPVSPDGTSNVNSDSEETESAEDSASEDSEEDKKDDGKSEYRYIFDIAEEDKDSLAYLTEKEGKRERSITLPLLSSVSSSLCISRPCFLSSSRPLFLSLSLILFLSLSLFQLCRTILCYRNLLQLDAQKGAPLGPLAVPDIALAFSSSRVSYFSVA